MNNKLRQAVQLALSTTMSNRQIGREVDIAYNSVRRYRAIADEHGYVLADLLTLDDETLNSRFNKVPERKKGKRVPDWTYIHTQLQRRHVTLQLLHEEYVNEDDPETSYRYSQFTNLYRQWTKKHGLSMRQQHEPGERGWVDFVGPTMQWVDQTTGEIHIVQVFAGALGVSHLLYALAVPAQTTEWWIEAHNRWYEFLGGVPAITVTDNLKAAVLRAGSDPQLNPTYVEMARHYNTVILPTRVRKPKDKAKAEGGLLILEGWALARLRNRVFHSLTDINVALSECVEQINNKLMRVHNASRRGLFEKLDRPKLIPLPGTPFEFGEWLVPMRVGKDYHVPVDGHYYSVPYRLIQGEVTVRRTASIVEVYHRRERVASHVRSHLVGGTTTDASHQPDAHRAWADQSPERYRAWAITVGAHVLTVIEHQFTAFAHVALALKACSDLRAMAKTYGNARFEAACAEALRIKSPTRKSIRSLLQNRLEQRGRDVGGAPQAKLPLHQNVRGPDYYRDEETTHAG